MSDGKQKERDIARYLSNHPRWPFGPVVTARSVSGGTARGEDLLRPNGERLPVSIEIKHVKAYRPAEWLEQARGQADGREYVVIWAPPNGRLERARVLVPDRLSSPVEGWSERWLAFWVEAPLLDQSVPF
jgi:hypothetical protein